jgi:hypothetical protein
VYGYKNCGLIGARARFASRKKRDAYWRELKENFPSKKFVRTTSRNQCLHPMYVSDYEGKYDTGFGNTDYDMYWARLYTVEERNY